MGPSELGRQWPQAALQESLQPPTARRLVHPGATALGVLREEKEANGEKRKGRRCGDSNCDFFFVAKRKQNNRDAFSYFKTLPHFLLTG